MNSEYTEIGSVKAIMITVNRPAEVIEAHKELMKFISELYINSNDRTKLSNMIMQCITTVEGNAAREGARCGRDQILQGLANELNSSLDITSELKVLN